jgi:alcohol dehydrogenase class IV
LLSPFYVSLSFNIHRRMSSSQETYRLAFPDHENPPYTHVSYGIPFTKSCSKHVAQTFHAKRAYIIASRSLSKETSHVKNLEQALGSRHCATWIGISPHTPWDELVPIINDMRAKDADCLITLGGGSLTDGAKIIIYALANNVQTIDDLRKMVELTEKDKKVKNEFRDRSTGGNDPTVPIICIPTTLSAGEYSKFGGGTDPKTHQKSILVHDKLYPSLVILDPELCLTTPEWVWLSTGVRAIDHATEAMCSMKAFSEVDVAAEKSLRLLLTNLLITKQNPQDLDARLQCQLAANYILVMLLYAPEILLAGGSHGIGHQLGPLGVGHGQTSCIMLPAVMKYNKSVNGDKQKKVKDILWSEEVVVQILKDAGLTRENSDAGDALGAVFKFLGMPRTLKEVGVGREKFEIIAVNSIRDPCCVANAIPLTEKEKVLEILETVVE